MTRLIRVFSTLRTRTLFLIFVVMFLVAFIAGFAVALVVRTKPPPRL